MLSIGDFARLGRISVRMLRHYDAIGLLHPARVDAATGYRFYQAAQLSQLNRIVALKDLGFSLQQVSTMVDETVEVAQLHGMLRLRRAELADRMAADQARLTSVEARLSLIEQEGQVPQAEVVVKQIPAVRVAELSAMAHSYEPHHIGPVIGPLYRQLCRRLADAKIAETGPGIAYYETIEDQVRVHATVPVAAPPGTGDGFTVVDLPAIKAATLIHHGDMAAVDAAGQYLAHWIEQQGFRSTGLPREVSLECPPDLDQWVTEIQEPIVALD